MQTAINPEAKWVEICALDDLPEDMGTGALVDDQQIALFYFPEQENVFALSNYDPFSKANVISRGIIGSLGDELVVASPVYKQHFSLTTGRCLEDESVSLISYPVKIENGQVLVQAQIYTETP
ncbi:MAG TPA: nitrite reductase small subunit NirD [Xanthomonadales bacterium]|nr:nitrite reductase small subunit NirD [Xanthomonadales bacterium]